MKKIIGVAFFSAALVLTGCTSGGDPTSSTKVDTNKLQSALPFTDPKDIAESKGEKVVENVDTKFWPEAASFQMEVGTVTNVIKGDLIEIDGKEEIQLLGIKTSYEEEKARIYHEIPKEEAVLFLKELVLNKKVYIEKNPEHPRNEKGQYLAYLWIGDSEQLTNVNALLLKEGLALTKRMDPVTAYDATFKNIENKARENKTGLWREEN
ncbi:thermonuclease family protein [Virgibacillus halodenitrificans]|uniref:thermonuclease family protein n=1 Tax=Virgibacillus halodenitrificans TaxID=1482 RepID=UPI0013CE95B0|nr:thermonuclease family protein [Virgibacillus halodenitrificans]